MYQINKLLKEEDLTHAFSTKDEGNMSFKWSDSLSVLASRQRFLDKLGVRSGNCVAMRSAHANKMVIVSSKDRGRGMDSIVTAITTDALITKTQGVILSMMVADSVPIILWDPVSKSLALVHGDWLSTDMHLVVKVVKTMHSQYGADPANLLAFMGPSITGKQHRIKDPIQKRSRVWQKYVTNHSDGTTSVDIMAYNRQQLRDAGVDKTHITISGIDTATDKRFFSHYRSMRNRREREGRFACVVGIKGDNFKPRGA